ncbi:hypothetical protein [Streptomyces sp. NPDC016845]|uniref:hypothetical protein n=1 Tax=Streptomyces sp. NPDC016845 TaxID=3364972 RepID=UPI0037BA9E91
MRKLSPATTGVLGAVLLTALLPMGVAHAEPGDAVTERVSVSADGVQGNRTSYRSVISRDGHYVAFTSQATNLVLPSKPPWGGGWYWSYLRDLHTGTLERVEVNGVPADVHDFSASGELVVLKSPNGLYVRNLSTGDTQRVDVQLGQFNAGGAYNGRISGSGRYVVFEEARGWSGPGGEGSRVYVRDLQEGTTQWVSQPNTTSDTYFAGVPVISDDGRRVAYTYTRSVPQGAQRGNVFVVDRSTGERQVVDVSQDGPTPERTVSQVSMSGDGTLVSFTRGDDSPVTADDQDSDTFIRDLATGTTRPVPPDGSRTGVTGGKLSPDGRFVLYTAFSGPSATRPALYVRNLETGAVRTVSTAMDGSPVHASTGGPLITSDSRKVVFESDDSTVVPEDTNNTYDVFVRTLPAEPAS